MTCRSHPRAYPAGNGHRSHDCNPSLHCPLAGYAQGAVASSKSRRSMPCGCTGRGRPGRTYATVFVLKSRIYWLIFIRTESCETAVFAKGTDDSSAVHATFNLSRHPAGGEPRQLVIPGARLASDPMSAHNAGNFSRSLLFSWQKLAVVQKNTASSTVTPRPLFFQLPPVDQCLKTTRSSQAPLPCC
jgi:hypothetical protein